MITLVTVEKKYVAAIAAALVVGVVVGVFLAAAFYEIKAKGKILTIGVEVFQDEACSVPLKTIDWGTMYPSQMKQVTCWIQNVKSTECYLEMFTDNYIPTHAETYLLTAWNVNTTTTLLPQRVLEATIMLTISPDIEAVNEFEYTIIIKATAVES